MTDTPRTMLQFDWEAVDGQVATAILGMSPQPPGDAGIRWDAVALLLTDQAVMITVDPDTDELVVGLGPAPTAGEDWSPIAGLSDRVGQPLGWCWIGRNHRGYLDTFIVAFDGIDPHCMFIGVAAAISVKTIADLPSG